MPRNVSDENILLPVINDSAVDDDDSIVLVTNLNQARPAIVSHDSVTIDALPYEEPIKHDDRGPLMNLIQAFRPNGAAAPSPSLANQGYIQQDPPEDCEKCSWVLFIRSHAICASIWVQ